MVHPHAVRIVAGAVVILAGWLAGRAHTHQPAKAKHWPEIDFAALAISQDGLLVKAAAEAIARGVDAAYGTQVIGKLMRYAHGLLVQRQPAGLDRRHIVDFVVATYTALWHPRDASRLLIVLQKQVDGQTTTAAVQGFQSVLTLIRDGATLSEILTEDATLRVPKITH
jgi:hypothetical protein